MLTELSLEFFVRQTGLPDWLFWRQITQIWLFFTSPGAKIFVWLFGTFLALFNEQLYNYYYQSHFVTKVRPAHKFYHTTRQKKRTAKLTCCVPMICMRFLAVHGLFLYYNRDRRSSSEIM